MTAEKETLTSLTVARIQKKVKMMCCGNSSRTPRDFIVDVINNSGEDYNTIAEGCFLAPITVKNLAEEITQNPQHETLHRLFIYFGIKLTGEFEAVKPSYRNKPKS